MSARSGGLFFNYFFFLKSTPLLLGFTVLFTIQWSHGSQTESDQPEKPPTGDVEKGSAHARNKLRTGRARTGTHAHAQRNFLFPPRNSLVRKRLSENNHLGQFDAREPYFWRCPTKRLTVQYVVLRDAKSLFSESFLLTWHTLSICWDTKSCWNFLHAYLEILSYCLEFKFLCFFDSRRNGLPYYTNIAHANIKTLCIHSGYFFAIL